MDLEVWGMLWSYLGKGNIFQRGWSLSISLGKRGYKGSS